MSKLLRAPVEGYRKTDTPAFIAARFTDLSQVRVAKNRNLARRVCQSLLKIRPPQTPVKPVVFGSRLRVGCRFAPQFEHSGGLIVDRVGCRHCPSEEFATKDSELLACDVNAVSLAAKASIWSLIFRDLIN